MYDQVLSFSQEVDLIWNRRWSLMTALYFAARYCGSLSTFMYVAVNVRLNWTLAGFKAAYIATQWSNIVFIIAMQAILLMRAYALCNRSRKLLAVLLVCFCCQAIAIVVIDGMLFNFTSMGRWVTSIGPSVGSVAEESNEDLGVFQPLLTVVASLPLAFDTILLVVALYASVTHALEARGLNAGGSGWSINPLVKALVADQTLYFVWYAVWLAITIPNALPNSAAASSPLFGDLSNAFSALVVIAGPRMVISLRAQELKTTEGTLQEELSTIQFGARDLPSRSAGEGEGEGEPERMAEGHSGHSSGFRRQDEIEA